MPYPFGPAGRWRPFLQSKLSYVPNTEFDAEWDIVVPPGQELPQFEFKGSGYWNAGIAAGVEYQVSQGLVFQASVMHEVPLGSTEDQRDLDLFGFTVPLHTEIEPSGTTLLVGLSWFR